MEIIFEGSVVGIRLVGIRLVGVRLSSLFGLARLARSASPRSWGAAPPPARALPLTREEVQTPSTPTLAFAR